MVNANVEQLLDDSFIVFEGFIYLVDNRPQRSPITGTVEGLKRELSAHEVRRCDISGRRDIIRGLAGCEAARTGENRKMATSILGFQIW
jgi:hypothetical protein